MRNLICIAATLLLLTASAGAVTAFAPNGLPRPYPFTGPDELVMFDTDNPSAFVTIGSMGVNNIGFGGMDFDADGNLWAYASTYKSTGGAASGLYRVNMQTGQATLQGTASPQSLQDLAYNPVDHKMYGVNTQGVTSRLYTVNLVTGGTTLVGTMTGLPSAHHLGGLGIDSSGQFYVLDLQNRKIFKGVGLTFSELYELSQDLGYSQGITVDWSRGNQGYHAAVGQGEYPNYFSQINTFAIDGSGYNLGPDFGPNEMIGGYGYPLVEPGDIAIAPVPEPASLLLLTLGVFLRRR